VNFCRFTNETRNSYEAALEDSGQMYVCAVKGACAGGGYELALACNHIILTDDGSSSVSLPEVPLLAVLPGTGGLTRVTDKRKIRRDRADVFCAMEEGVRGKRAADWGLVDEVVSNAKFEEIVDARAAEIAAKSERPDGTGIALTPIERVLTDTALTYSSVTVEIDRDLGVAHITVKGPDGDPVSADKLSAEDWIFRAARELEDAVLHLRFNEEEIGVWALHSAGDPKAVLAHEAVLREDHWAARELSNYWKRTLKRIDVTSRSIAALIEPGSCFSGVLAELAFAADRSYIAEGAFEGDNRPEASIVLSASNFGAMPMGNDLTRLQTRFYGTPEAVERLEGELGETYLAEEADEAGLVTFAYDDIDWEDEIRIFFEERASFSPDAMTGMEANLRFAGPETMETRIFGRLTAWQNWIFQRPNAVGPDGALQRYGTGKRGVYDMHRV